MTKLGSRQKALLFEAYRRYKMYTGTRLPITEQWLGLGTEAAYRTMINAGFMKFFDGVTPEPRCMGWLVLTKKGVKILHEYENEFKERLEEMKKLGYEKSILANFQLAGGITSR